MSNDEQWVDILPITEIDYFQDWLTMESFLGEYGDPGFNQIRYENARFKSIENGEPWPITFTTYRGEDGQLLGMHSFYINKQGMQQPFVFMVHPDHQRKGIGTIITNYIMEQYRERNGHEYPYAANWKNVESTESAANFMNKYAKQKIQEKNTTDI